MPNIKICNLNKKRIKTLTNAIERLYCLSIILDYYCSTQPEIEELHTLKPVSKIINEDADFIYSAFINHSVDENGTIILEKED